MKKALTLKKLNETKGTVVYGEESDDPARLKSVYLPRTWFKGTLPEEIEATFKTKSE